MRKIFLLTVSLLFAFTTIYAERVSQKDAALVAGNFMSSTVQTGVKKASGAKMVLKKAASAEENQYYVYENASGEGWVMVAADDAVTPILAYSKTGTFRTDNMPANLADWLGKYNSFIQKVSNDGVVANDEIKAQWKALRKGLPDDPAGNVVVGPLVKTIWDQDVPFDRQCPGTGYWGEYSSKAAAGCVAISMAQVMKYWSWPTTGKGSHTYTPLNPNTGETSTRYGQQSANFGNTTYNWAKMKNSYLDSYTEEEGAEVAKLVYHCGVGTEMMYGNYDDGGSGTYTLNYLSWDESDNAQNAFYKYFRYKPATGYMRDGLVYGGYTYYDQWTDNAWTEMIKIELSNKHPIMYSGVSDEGGHSFICDGYDDQNYFHFNWGWSGQNDGWYKLSNLAPGSGGAGGGSYVFNKQQQVLIDIVPNRTDWPNVTITWSVNGTTSTSTFQQEDDLVMPSNPANCSANQVFVGWSKTAPTNGKVPADLFTSATTGKKAVETVTYYAIYATKSGSTYSNYTATCATPPATTYTVRWHSCAGIAQEQYEEGAALKLPTNPGANGDKAFYGWTTTEHYTGAAAPTIISAGQPVNADADYYAVYK